MSALSKYQEALGNAPARGSGLNVHCMRVARLGVMAGLNQENILADAARIPDLKSGEMERAISRASNTEPITQEPVVISRYAPNYEDPLGDFIKGFPTDEMELMESSPVRLGVDEGRQLLETLYKPDEFLFIGDVYDKTVKPVSQWLEYGFDFPHIIPNPMTGEFGETADGVESRRCEATVADLRYAVCEMDDVPLEKQVAFWLKCISIKIPVAAIIHSGKKSLHGWVRVDCGTDTEKWDRDVKGWLFNEFGVRYGFDKACATKARLSRMAGHKRNGAGEQRLLYLESK